MTRQLTITSASTDEPTAPLVSDGLYLEVMTQPKTAGVGGWWAGMQRKRNARRLGDELYPEIQKAFQRELLTRFELFLDFKRGLIEERNRLQLELARSFTNDMIIQDQHRRMIARRMEMVRQLIEIQSTLKEIGVPGEIVERKIGQYVDRLIDALGTELTTGGNYGTLER